MAERPLVNNAGDPQQVKSAARIEKERAKRFGRSLVATMAIADGRALMWELLGRARVNASVFHRDIAQMSYNSGRQDFGHELMAEIIAADPALYLLMEREARDRDKRDDATVHAAHTQGADDNTKENT